MSSSSSSNLFSKPYRHPHAHTHTHVGGGCPEIHCVCVCVHIVSGDRKSSLKDFTFLRGKHVKSPFSSRKKKTEKYANFNVAAKI